MDIAHITLKRTPKKPEIVIYVRHAGTCLHKQDESYRACGCPKWLRWSLGGKQHREAVHTRLWAHAEQERERKQKEFDVRFLLGIYPELQTSAVVATAQPTIAQAVDTFIRGKESENIGQSTLRKLRYQLPLFEHFMAARAKFYPKDITPQDVIDFRATWRTWGDLTRIKAQQNLRGFIRFCCTGDHRSAVLDVLKTIKQTKEGRERRKPKPLTEVQLKKLLAQVPVTFAKEPHKIPRVTAFVKCAVSTGLACRDMIQLERATLEDSSNGILEIERQKTGRKATPRIDPGLRAELLTVLNGNPRYVFWNGTSLPHSATGLWQSDLRRLFEDTGLWIKGDLSHRFRDTAVDFWLGQGCSMTDVAAMLGDTVAIVEKHYADLASKRMTERLSKLPARTWREHADV
jgi:integrase